MGCAFAPSKTNALFLFVVALLSSFLFCASLRQKASEGVTF
jgi:hypothetical protein